MSDISAVRSDSDGFAHRCCLAADRQSRESERGSLLQKLIQTEKKAHELSDWVAQQETKEQDDLSPEIRCLIVRDEECLSDMERFLLSAELKELLERRDAFPEEDDLAVRRSR